MSILITEVDGWNPKHIEVSDEPIELQKVFADKVKKKGSHFVPLNNSMSRRTQLPYRLDALEGTYYANNWIQPYSFTALAVKGVSLDLERLYKEIETVASRDYSMFKNLVEPHSSAVSSEEVNLLVKYRMIEFHGDEERYRGASEQEVLSNLFYWHLGVMFENHRIYGLKKVIRIGKDSYGDNRFNSTVEAGQTIQNVLSKVKSEEWVILFNTSTDY